MLSSIYKLMPGLNYKYSTARHLKESGTHLKGPLLDGIQGRTGLPHWPRKFSLTYLHYRALSQKALAKLIQYFWWLSAHRESPGVPPTQSDPDGIYKCKACWLELTFRAILCLTPQCIGPSNIHVITWFLHFYFTPSDLIFDKNLARKLLLRKPWSVIRNKLFSIFQPLCRLVTIDRIQFSSWYPCFTDLRLRSRTVDPQLGGPEAPRRSVQALLRLHTFQPSPGAHHCCTHGSLATNHQKHPGEWCADVN